MQIVFGVIGVVAFLSIMIVITIVWFKQCKQQQQSKTIDNSTTMQPQKVQSEYGRVENVDANYGETSLVENI